MRKTITVDAFRDLVEDLAVSDVATAANPEIEHLVGGWGRVERVSVSPDTHTFAASGAAAAMQADLVLTPRDGDVIVRRATLTAVVDDGGRVRLDRVEVRPAPGDRPEAVRRVAALATLTRARDLSADGEVLLSEEDADEIAALLARA